MLVLYVIIKRIVNLFRRLFLFHKFSWLRENFFGLTSHGGHNFFVNNTLLFTQTPFLQFSLFKNAGGNVSMLLGSAVPFALYLLTLAFSLEDTESQ